MAAEQPPDGPGLRPRRGWWIAAGLLAGLLVVGLLAALWIKAPALYGRGDAAKTAAATTRGAILTVAAVLIAATAAGAGLYMTARTIRDNQKTIRINQQALAKTQRANREADQRDRYTKAIEQLGSSQLDVRLGGIYGLERIAETSKRDQRTVVEVLSAFVRERTDPARTEKPTVADILNTFLTLVDHRPERNPTPSDAGTKIKPPADVQAAFTVLGRLPQRHNVSRGDLSNARLGGANLTDARLGQTGLDSALRFEASPAGAQLGSVDLSGARLVETHLPGAWLVKANLSNARLTGANLSDAWLRWADLAGAQLGSVDLSGARLVDARLVEADLSDARLTGANLSGADLFGANLAGAWLGGADLIPTKNLTQQQLDSARGNEDTKLPAGLQRPAHWSAGSAPAEADR